MKLIAKNGQTVILTDETQIAAFLKGGFEEVVEEKELDEDIEALKAKADELGVTYSPNIGAAKLAERIEQFKSEQ